MGIDTKPNFNKNRFEQCSGDIMNLSGCTQIFGVFDIETGATLNICEGAASGKVLTSDSIGNVSWQDPTSGITWSGSTLNGIATYHDDNTIISEPNLRFDSSNLYQKRSIVTQYQENIGSTSDYDMRLSTDDGTYRIEQYSTGYGNSWSNLMSIYDIWNNSGGIYIGWESGNINGNTNTKNIGIGVCSLYNITSGDYNLAVGGGTMRELTTGRSNLGIGFSLSRLETGCNNVGLGNDVGNFVVSGCNNIFIGNCVDKGDSLETGSNKLYIGNDKPIIYGELDNELLCLRGQLHVSGLTNSTKSDVVYYDSSTNELTYGASPSGGTSTTSPASSDGSIQYNNGGSFGGTCLNWDDSTNNIGWNMPATGNTLLSMKKNVNYNDCQTMIEFYTEDTLANTISEFKVCLCGAGNGSDIYTHKIHGYCCGTTNASLQLDSLSDINIEATHGLKLTGSVVDVNNILRLNPITVSIPNPSEGMVYYDSTAEKLKLYNSKTWETISSF
jgi:hypothetical protein